MHFVLFAACLMKQPLARSSSWPVMFLLAVPSLKVFRSTDIPLLLVLDPKTATHCIDRSVRHTYVFKCVYGTQHHRQWAVRFSAQSILSFQSASPRTVLLIAADSIVCKVAVYIGILYMPNRVCLSFLSPNSFPNFSSTSQYRQVFPIHFLFPRKCFLDIYFYSANFN